MDEFLPSTQMISEKINSATNKLHKVFKNDITEKDSAVKVYRWKDRNGNWSYSDKPKVATESEEVLYNPKNIVVLPTFKVSPIDSPNSKLEEKHANTSPNTVNSSQNRVLELYKNANNVQKIMDGRQEKLSKAIQSSTK